MKKERNDIDPKKFPFPDDKRLKGVKFIVLDSEPYEFWERYRFYVKYESDNSGFCFKYHEFSKSKPCWATAWFAMINGERTLFVDASGGYIDWPKLEAYVFAMCKMEPNPDNHTNGTNLHNHYMLLRRFEKNDEKSDEERAKGTLAEINDLERQIKFLYNSMENNKWWHAEQQRRLALI